MPLPTRPQRYCDPASLVLWPSCSRFPFYFPQNPFHFYSRGSVTLRVAVSVRPSVASLVTSLSLRAVSSLLPLLNRPRLTCRASGLVLSSGGDRLLPMPTHTSHTSTWFVTFGAFISSKNNTYMDNDAEISIHSKTNLSNDKCIK